MDTNLKMLEKKVAERQYAYYDADQHSDLNIEAQIVTYLAKYQYASGQEAKALPLVVAIVKSEKLHWVGPDQAYFVKINGILHGLRYSGGSIIWSPSYYPLADAKAAHDPRASLETELTAKALLHLLSNTEHHGQIRTDLRPVLKNKKIVQDTLWDLGEITIVSWAFRDEILTIVAASPDSTQSAEIRINIYDKKVISPELKPEK